LIRLPRRTAWFALPVVAAAVGWGWWSGQRAVRQARAELQVLESRRAELERTNHELARQVEALKHEREARERAARESMDVAAPDETMVILPPTPTPTPTALPAR